MEKSKEIHRITLQFVDLIAQKNYKKNYKKIFVEILAEFYYQNHA
jgi:hypothetical protein